jgi:hypothetical protein
VTEKDQKTNRDDMITLPVRRARNDDTGRRTNARDAPEGYDTFVPISEPVPQKEAMTEAEERIPPVASEVPRQAPPHRSVPVPEPVSEGEDSRTPEALASVRRRVIVTHEEKDHAHHLSSHDLSMHGSQHTGYKPGVSDRSFAETPVRHPNGGVPHLKETERQRIERELRRQRTIAMGGDSQKTPLHAEKSHPASQETHVVQRSSHQDRAGAENKSPVLDNEPISLSGEKRTIIIGKRKITTVPREDPDPSAAQEKTGSAYHGESVSSSDDNTMSVEIKDRVFRARDEVFQGKRVRKPSLPQARDSTLLHTELRPKKKASEGEDTDNDDPRADPAGKDPVSIKKRIKSEEKT